ncbi:MAG TPA: tRNA 2-thiouridine(34) synthase MnmA [Planctomycetota bacterium]|nr:tRNA 2-thiouridine(34) synthase MnmA [Planctomycetota bacterium]
MTSADPRVVLVTMSGGVDSSVAAALLAEQGFRPVGAFMRNGVKAGDAAATHRQGCCGIDDAHDARRVADALGLPFYVVDLEAGFDRLVDDFVEAYRRGRTPNPCIECNRAFKFGRLLALAREIGAGAVATGHYARVVERDGRRAVARGRDLAKDQSYVLYPLSQDALRAAMFPLGELTKAETRAHARRLGLRVAEKPESMEICFVPSGDYRDVVRARAPEAFRPGRLRTRDGEDLGPHEGVAGFTVGQRRRLPGGRPEPLYVTGLDAATDTVTVGPRSALDVRDALAEDVVFSGAAATPGATLRGFAKVRHQHEPAACEATILDARRVRFRFDAPVFAPAPGQAVVLYDGDGAVLLGGVLAEGVDV